MVFLLLLGWILRSILGHFGIECRVPVKRGRGRRSDVENPQPRDEETRPKERLEIMESTAAGKTDQDRPLPTGAKGGRPRTMPPKKYLLLTPPSYYLRSSKK
ncbi:uncharacterized protein LOC128172791 [Crassostrea angulata]|uniref:uncharacterized protein LOC128172791 n=1 Tax=Magallana angulata TaxID=2784310 RepID=UPI0022B0AF08|nr:uncharacterized protein LOC128172791 [Crassostrea angulata]